MDKAELFKYCPSCKKDIEVFRPEGSLNIRCKSCGMNLYLNPASCVSAIIQKDGQILLTKRAREPRKGTWEIPGGFLAEAETLEEALTREIKEELDIDLTNITYYASKTDIYECEGISYNTIVSCYTCGYTGEIKKNHEILEWNHFSLDKLPEMGFKYQQEILESLQK